MQILASPFKKARPTPINSSLDSSELQTVCKTYCMLLDLVACFNESVNKIQTSLEELRRLLADRQIHIEGKPGDVVDYDPTIHHAEERPENKVTLLTPAFIYQTQNEKRVVLKSWVRPITHTGLVPLYFDVICEGCFTASYRYSGYNSARYNLWWAIATGKIFSHDQVIPDLVVQCPICGKPAACTEIYPAAPHYEVLELELALIPPLRDPKDKLPTPRVPAGATILLVRKNGTIETFEELEGARHSHNRPAQFRHRSAVTN